MKPRPLSEYHEDMGDVLWWCFPVVEPPYVGTPNDLGQEVQVMAQTANGWSRTFSTMNVGGWPGTHTHFTPLIVPEAPEQTEEQPT